MGRNHSHWESETALENVRARDYPNKPSRQKACFTCVDEPTIRFYQQTHQGQIPESEKTHEHLYLVEKVETDALEHIADFNLIKILKPQQTIDWVASEYWKGSFFYTFPEQPEIKCAELITTSSLRIISEI